MAGAPPSPPPRATSATAGVPPSPPPRATSPVAGAPPPPTPARLLPHGSRPPPQPPPRHQVRRRSNHLTVVVACNPALPSLDHDLFLDQDRPSPGVGRAPPLPAFHLLPRQGRPSPTPCPGPPLCAVRPRTPAPFDLAGAASPYGGDVAG
ncbi:hypothetical protein VPH35_059729 [Triticum aestivum]